MFKRFLFLTLAMIVIISTGSLAGCRMFNMRGETRPAPVRVMMPSSRILSIFPHSVGTRWIYEGMAEYGHMMELKSTTRTRTKGQINYTITGKVDDPSGGESKRNFNFKIQYLFLGKSVYERIVEADTPFPHRINNLKLMTLPLKKGNKWSQSVIINSQKVTLMAEIIGVEQKKIFEKMTDTITVRYRAPLKGMPGGTYEEIRVFASGIGLYSFEKTFGPNPTDRFGYTLRKFKKPVRINKVR